MKRIFRGLMAIKSVVIGGLILALWVRSYWKSDLLIRGDDAQSITLVSAAGRVLVTFVHDGKPTRLRASWRCITDVPSDDTLRTVAMGDSIWNRLGMGFQSERFAPPLIGMRVDILVPHWLMFALAMPAAVWWVVRRLNSRPVSSATGAWCPRCCAAFRHSGPTCRRCGGPVAVGAAFSVPPLHRR